MHCYNFYIYQRAAKSNEIESLYAFIGENKRYSSFRGSMPGRSAATDSFSTVDSTPAPPKLHPKPSRKQQEQQPEQQQQGMVEMISVQSEQIEQNKTNTGGDDLVPPKVVPLPPPLPSPPTRVASVVVDNIDATTSVPSPPPSSTSSPVAAKPRSFFMPRPPTINPLSLDKADRETRAAAAEPAVVVLPPPLEKPVVVLPPPLVKPVVVLPPPAIAPKQSRMMSWFSAAPANQPSVEVAPAGRNPFDTEDDLDDMPAYPPPKAPAEAPSSSSSSSSAKPEKPAKPAKPARVSRKDKDPVDAKTLLVDHKKSIQSAFSVASSSSPPVVKASSASASAAASSPVSPSTPTKPPKPPKSPRVATTQQQGDSKKNPFDGEGDIW
jgi:hypothetical protein